MSRTLSASSDSVGSEKGVTGALAIVDDYEVTQSEAGVVLVGHDRPPLVLAESKGIAHVATGRMTGLVVGIAKQWVLVWSSADGRLVIGYDMKRSAIVDPIVAADALGERYVAVASGRFVMLLDLLSLNLLVRTWLLDDPVVLVRFAPARLQPGPVLYAVTNAGASVVRFAESGSMFHAVTPLSGLWSGLRCFDVQGWRPNDRAAVVAVTSTGDIAVVTEAPAEIRTIKGTTRFVRAVVTNGECGAVIVSVDEQGTASVHKRASSYAPEPLCTVGRDARLLATLEDVRVTTGRGPAILWP